MSRAPRNVKRSPTPTSATFPPDLQTPKAAPPAAPQAPKPLYLCSPFVEAALVKGNFKTIVMLPKYVDIMEWVAVNRCVLLHCHFLLLTNIFFQWVPPSTAHRSPSSDCALLVFDFYNNLNEFYGVLTEFCTQQNCPTMSAGTTYVCSAVDFIR
jgi:MOB kinase activator 1